MQHLLRRKINQVLFILLLLPFTGNAQSSLFGSTENLPDHDDKHIQFGINLGMNKSHFSFSHHPYFMQQDSVNDIESVNSTGINLAWLVNMNLSEHFSIRTFPLDLTFSEKVFDYTLKYPDTEGGESKLTEKKVQSISLSLPVHIKFTSDRIGNLKVYTIAGGKLDYDLAANAGKKSANDNIKLKGLDYSIEGGIGFHLYFQYFVLSPELKISWGFANLHSRNALTKYSNTIDKINSRMISFSLTVE